MAAGILSVDAEVLHQTLLSDVLLILAIVAFAVIAARNTGSVARAGIRSVFKARDLAPAIVLFTWTAACGVLAQRLAGNDVAAGLFNALALAGFTASVAVSIWVLAAIGVGRATRDVGGSWLLGVVACQSVAIVADSTARGLAEAAWVGGLALYAVLIGLIIRRVAARNFSRQHFTPDYWITMGALAISAVAATRVSPEFDLALWIAAIAWPPLLVAMEIWRAHADLGAALTYNTLRWATVFPLGMLALATLDVARSARLPALRDWAAVFFVAGIAVAIVNSGAWLLSLRASSGTRAGDQ